MTETISTSQSCDPRARVTRSLLGYGVIAGPFYVVVSLAEALTRDGFDLTRHSWSLLANGDLGWIHILNLVLTGLMVIAAAVGLRRATGSRWAPILLGGYGLGMIGAGVFKADPADGFPVGTPPGQPAEVSMSGLLHLVTAGIGFLCLVAACLVIARRFARRGERGWAAYSAITGVVFLAAFAGLASGSSTPAVVLSFVVAVLAAWTWLSALSARLYRQEGAVS